MTIQYKEWCEKVIVDNDVKGGYPVFPGSRVTLQQVANLAKQGVTYTYLFSEFPFLTTTDIRYAVIYTNKHK